MDSSNRTSSVPVRNYSQDLEHFRRIDNCLSPSLTARVKGKSGFSYCKQVAMNIREILAAKVYQIGYKIFSKEHITYGNAYAIQFLTKRIKEIKDRPESTYIDWPARQTLLVTKICSHLKEKEIFPSKTDLLMQQVNEINTSNPQVINAFYRCLTEDFIQQGLHKFRHAPVENFNLHLSLTTVRNPDPRDLFVVAFCYEHGLGTPKNLSKAEKYYKLANDVGTTAAMTRLGLGFIIAFHDLTAGRADLMFKKGLEAILKWHEQAAERGSTLAMLSLAIYYEYLRKDNSKAQEWYAKLAERGGQKEDGHSLYFLARHQKELGKNNKAIELYKKAADAGDILAMMELVRSYRQGIIVPKDLAEAARWDQKFKAAIRDEVIGELAYKLYPIDEAGEEEENANVLQL